MPQLESLIGDFFASDISGNDYHILIHSNPNRGQVNGGNDDGSVHSQFRLFTDKGRNVYRQNQGRYLIDEFRCFIEVSSDDPNAP